MTSEQPGLGFQKEKWGGGRPQEGGRRGMGIDQNKHTKTKQNKTSQLLDENVYYFYDESFNEIFTFIPPSKVIYIF